MRRFYYFDFTPMVRTILICCIVSWNASSVLFSQVSTTSSCLLKCLSNEKEKQNQAYIDAISNLDYSVFLVDRIDIRSETDRLTTSRQEFAVRTNFNSFGEKKAQISKHQSFVGWKKKKMLDSRHEALFKQYKLLTRWHFLSNELKFVDHSLSNSEDKLIIIETMMSNGNAFELSEYIASKESLLSFNEKKQTLKQEIEDIYKDLEIDSLTSDDWVNIQKMNEVIFTIESKEIGYKDSSVFDAEMTYLERQESLEKAKNNKVLDFAQAKYTLRDDLLLQNKFTIGVGLNIPWRGSEKVAQNDLKIKKAALKLEMDEEKLNLKEEWSDGLALFKRKFQQLELLEQIKNDTSLAELKDKVISSGRLNLVKVMEIKEEETDLQMSINKLRYELENLYLNLLHISGKIYTQPYTNYLDIATRSFSN